MLKWLRDRRRPRASPAPASTPAANPDDLMRRAFPLHEAGRVDEAQRLYREILAIDPNYGDAHYLLGRIEHEAGRHEDAIPHLRSALRADNGNPHFQRTLGDAFMAMGHYQEALAYYQNAVQLDPANYVQWNNLGCACDKLGRLDEAARHFEKALEMAPGSPSVLNNVALALKERGLVDEALVKYRQLLEQVPDDSVAFSNYLYALMFSSAHTREEVFRAHVEYDRRFGTGRHGVRPPPATDRAPDRRLRIGYLSPDLRAHPVAVFLESALAHHDAAEVEIFCYFLHPRADHVSARLQRLAHHWIHCPELAGAPLAGRIAQDRIDVLVDLAGHTGDNGLPALAFKPAPVIASWLGYANTTGLRAVDYHISDATCLPPGAEPYYTEKIFRLPGAQWCYERPPIDVPVTPLPAAGDGRVRLASFNNAAKLTDATLLNWARILQRVPQASLLVWGLIEEQAARVRQVIDAAGVDPARLEFTAGRTPFAEQLALLQRTDIALDTFPYSGVTTTFNSLWMGVPVLSLVGQAEASRTTLSILGQLGLQDWTAETAEALAETAARKVSDLAGLARLRAGLRERLERSSLMDGPAFARKLEAAFREMWRVHCAGGDSFKVS